jgi:radical SAM superfamily enzyme YgiQ (UPF0313 family)/pyrimidine deaminase RibD-like protein
LPNSSTEEFALLIESDLSNKPQQVSAEFERIIMRKLLDFTRYRDQPNGHTDPFDDPFVGAALFTDDYRLLGAYRKITSGERHSEPQAIVETLKSINDDTANAMILDIEKAYEDKIWLRSGQRENFENLFDQAGRYIKAAKNTNNLIVFSSLEPCGLYEANPSCANIICACGVRRVVYASDDTNPKGRGRPILINGGVKVDANILPQEAVDINNRFFATVEICNETYTDYSHGRLFSGAPWATFSEGDTLFSAQIDSDDRLAVRKARPFELQYAGPEHGIVAPYITPSELKRFDQYTVNPDSTFFYGGNSVGELSKLLYRHAGIVGQLPKRIITTDNPFEMPTASDSELVLREIIDRRLTVHQNAFRKHHEIWRANRHLILSNFREEFRSHLSVLVKIADKEQKPEKSPYIFLFITPEELPNRLIYECSNIPELAYPARVTILGNELSGDAIFNTLREIATRSRANELFAKTSFEAGVLPLSGGENNKEATNNLNKNLQTLTYITVDCLPPKFIPIQNTAAQLDQEIRYGRRDPNFFDTDYIDRLSRGFDWLERKHAGSIRGRLARSSRDYAERSLLEPLKMRVRAGLKEHTWPEVCSYLNALRQAAPSLRINHSQSAGDALQSVAGSLAKMVSEPPPWLDDVIWRWLACSFELRSGDKIQTFPQELIRYIGNSSFLLPWAVQYSLRSPEIWSRSTLDNFLSNKEIEPKAAHAALIAGARVVAHRESVGALDPITSSAWLEALAKLGSLEVLEQEIYRCREVRRTELLGLMALPEVSVDAPIERLPSEAEDYLRSYVAMRALGDETESSFRPDDEAALAGLSKKWRGDHRQVLLEVLSYLPKAWTGAVLRALADDVDVSLRWAALYLTLNDKHAIGMWESKTPVQCARIARFRAEIVAAARAAGSHYWLEREVLDAFFSVHQSDDRSAVLNRGLSFPSAASLKLDSYLFGSTPEVLHPEIRSRVELLRSRSSRILLVLPPISWPDVSRRDVVTNDGSPPLGLGQIAAALAAHGHFVEVLDSYRYAYSLSDVSVYALKFDFIGISTVFSSLQSAQKLAERIRFRASEPRPLIIFGGHAATLAPSRFLNADAAFDYLVEGPGEDAFVELVDQRRTQRALKHPGIVASQTDIPRAFGAGRRRKALASAFSTRWDYLPVIDRSIFRDPTGTRYEPTLTRNGHSREAHFVMSKGCDWSCKFCTEAVLTGQGEVRKSAEAVLEEVGFVCETDGVRHAQFIDDNVFPPLAAPGLDDQEKQSRELWTTNFLTGLCGIRATLGDGPDRFNWRGLIRLEDLQAYRQRIPALLSKLTDSGCALLAFGVEHGDEGVRNGLKGAAGGATNAEIKQLVGELREAGIASKAYFILGGPHDDQSAAERTIDFALSSGVDLAYFAIYKDFRGMTERASSRVARPRQFKEFDFDLGRLVESGNKSEWVLNFGTELKYSMNSYQRALKQLREIGFNFSNLFKYSDYHADEDMMQLYFDNGKNSDGRQNYFRLLRRAYLEFYAREDWVKSYKNLVERGY